VQLAEKFNRTRRQRHIARPGLAVIEPQHAAAPVEVAPERMLQRFAAAHRCFDEHPDHERGLPIARGTQRAEKSALFVVGHDPAAGVVGGGHIQRRGRVARRGGPVPLFLGVIEERAQQSLLLLQCADAGFFSAHCINELLHVVAHDVGDTHVRQPAADTVAAQGFRGELGSVTFERGDDAPLTVAFVSLLQAHREVTTTRLRPFPTARLADARVVAIGTLGECGLQHQFRQIR